MAKCKSCGADIVWIETVKGKNMPCNSEKTTIVTEDGKTITGHIPHWATCPNAGTHRKREANNGSNTST